MFTENLTVGIVFGVLLVLGVVILVVKSDKSPRKQQFKIIDRISTQLAIIVATASAVTDNVSNHPHSKANHNVAGMKNFFSCILYDNPTLQKDKFPLALIIA